MDDGASVPAGRFASKEEALRVVKASWKVYIAVVPGDGSVRDGKITTVKSGRAEQVQTKVEVPMIARTGPRDQGRDKHSADDPLEQLHKLGELRESGVLTRDEFETKKAELLKRV